MQRIKVKLRGNITRTDWLMRVPGCAMWEFPKSRGTLCWGPYNNDPTI